MPVFGSGTGSRGDNLVSNAVAPHRLQPQPFQVVQPGITDAYVLEPGTSGNNVSTPHVVAYNPAGDLTLIVRAALDDWTPAAQQTLVSKRGATIADASWRLAINTTGFPLLAVSVDGVATSTATSLVALALGDGSAIWLRATRTSSTGRVDFYYAPDQSAIPTVWTDLSVNRATTAGALNPSTADIYIGGYNAGTLESLAGKVFQVVEIGGLNTTDTQLFNMKAADWTSGTTWVSAATGETWTINGTASVVPAVGGGGSPQTVTAQIATGTWTANPGTVTGGPVTVTAQVATGTWSAVAGTVTAGAVTKTAQVATGTWTANPGTVTAGNATVTAQIAAGTWSAIPGTMSAGGGGAQTVTAQIATGTWSAVVGTPTGGAVSLTAQVATATWTAIPGTVTGGPVTKTAQIATGTWTAIPGTPTGGPVTIAAQVATGTWTAVAGTISSGGQIVTAQIAVATWSANPGTVTGGPTSITAQVATAAWSAVAGALVSAGLLVELGDAITGYNPGRIYGATPAAVVGTNPGRIDGTNPAATVGRNPGMTFGQNPAAVAGRNSPQLVGSLR